MTDYEIYVDYLKKFPDPRILRFERWEAIKAIILDSKVKSVLEFGSGVSSVLFSSLGLKIDSYETNQNYMARLAKHYKSINFIHWANEYFKSKTTYDLCLVDGPQNRIPQILVAISAAKIICLDDYTGAYKQRTTFLFKKYKNLSLPDINLGVFKLT